MPPDEPGPDMHQASRYFNHACYQGFLSQALELLAQGANPLWRGESGKSGIHYAAMAGHSELCSFLAQQHPSSLLSKDQGGMTPLHLACRNSRRDAAVALARAGAPLDARDDFGRRPADCCPAPDVQAALAQVEDEQASQALARLALDRALSAPSIRNFI